MDRQQSQSVVTDVDAKNSGRIVSVGEERRVFTEPKLARRGQGREQIRERMTLGGWQHQRASADPDDTLSPFTCSTYPTRQRSSVSAATAASSPFALSRNSLAQASHRHSKQVAGATTQNPLSATTATDRTIDRTATAQHRIATSNKENAVRAVPGANPWPTSAQRAAAPVHDFVAGEIGMATTPKQLVSASDRYDDSPLHVQLESPVTRALLLPDRRTPPSPRSAHPLGILAAQDLVSDGDVRQLEVPRVTAEPTEHVEPNRVQGNPALTNSAVRPDAGEGGGYDVLFIDPPWDTLRCDICRMVLRTPVQTGCGHRFCQSCIGPTLADSKTAKCPVDGEEIEEAFTDKHCQREVLALAVSCDNGPSGCEWSGQLRDLQDHMVVCGYCLVRCPHNGCAEQPVLRRDLLRHTEECRFRPAPCRMCRMNVPQAIMNDHLMMECMECPVICSNGCGSEVKRKDLERHRTHDCSHVQCTCPYRANSCMFEGTRDQVERHCQVETQQHIAMLAVHSKAQDDKLDTLRRAISLLERTVTRANPNPNSNSNSHESARIPICADPNSLLVDSEFKAAITDFVEEQVHVRMSDKMADIQEAIELRDQAPSNQARHVCQLLRAHIHDCVKSLEQMGLTAARSVDAALAEVGLLAVETNVYNGLIIFKINNFARRHEEARTGRRVSLYSPTFYTSRHGYKACLRVYLNGDGSGKGTHISVFFTIMKGEFDSLLEWPFRAKVTIAVLDQGSPPNHRIESFNPDPQSSSFQRPVNDMNIASGCPKMVSHSELYDKQSSYLRDDCLYIKASVDQSVCGRIEA